MAGKDEYLFPEANKARYGQGRPYRPLFLPNYLRLESRDQRLKNKEQEKAYEIILKWADLESSGKLEQKKETMLEGEFLTEVFGQALGYTLFSANKESWDIEAKFSVNGGEADAAIGLFKINQKNKPRSVIELKGPKTNLDKDKFNGRTAVQQCWDYLYAIPECPWGIVCNYVSFRLYHRNQTPRSYQLFTLQELRNKENFQQFYYIFQRGGLLPDAVAQKPRADRLLDKTNKREREVGDELYRDYQNNRIKLIGHLIEEPHNKPLDTAIHIAQKLLDRIIFIAFCEDRRLLPEETLKTAWQDVPPFHRVTNPRWQNFLSLFDSIDRGNPKSGIYGYNGGLFRKDNQVDTLNLDDEWTYFFKDIGEYDFRDEVNVDVLGHLFERSINDIEKIRLGGFFEDEIDKATAPKMLKSAERKRTGIYYTPPEFTDFIVENTVAQIIDEKLQKLAKELRIDFENPERCHEQSELQNYWIKSIKQIRSVKIVDPACGSGAFLIRAYECLEDKYFGIVYNISLQNEILAEQLREEIPNYILHENLYGVDLSDEAVEITQLSLWIRSARKGKSLEDLSKNIICANSLVSDRKVHDKAMEWERVFPEIFRRENPGFDCVIGNPPWERIKLQEREFFDGTAPKIASATNAAKRKKLIEQLKKKDLELYTRYKNAKAEADNTLDHIRHSGRFPLTGKGDINTYAVFAELASHTVAKGGKVGLLVPSGIATDHTTRNFFSSLIEDNTLIGLYDFENKAPIFPDVHRSFKFSIIVFGGSKTQVKSVDFVFFAHQMLELKDNNRHILLAPEDIMLLNPNTRTCPVFRSRTDAELTKAIYRRVPVLWDKNRKEGGNPWGIKFFTMFHQTNDAEYFNTADELKKEKFKLTGSNWKKGKKTFLPIFEAKMIQMYDHRAASVIMNDENWIRQGQTEATTLVQHQNPEFTSIPRWWADKKNIEKALNQEKEPAYITFKDVTSPTNLRTMIASFVPYVGILNSAPLLFTKNTITKTLECCLLANLNSFATDFVARQKVGGVHLNFFIVGQLPIFAPDIYAEICPWNKKQILEKWISDRVLKLTCTSNDMIPLAKATGFKPLVHKWKTAERIKLKAELDAAYFLLYGIQREDVEYILSTFSGARKDEEVLFSRGSEFDQVLTYYDELLKKSN